MTWGISNMTLSELRQIEFELTSGGYKCCELKSCKKCSAVRVVQREIKLKEMETEIPFGHKGNNKNNDDESDGA